MNKDIFKGIVPKLGKPFVSSLVYNRPVKKNPIRYSPMPSLRWTKLKWTRDNVLKGIVPNYSGLYAFFDNYNRMLYVGHSKKLRHRIQSYYQEDDFKEHPTKKTLRWHISSFGYCVMPVVKARVIEKQIKHKTTFNYN